MFLQPSQTGDDALVVEERVFPSENSAAGPRTDMAQIDYSYMLTARHVTTPPNQAAGHFQNVKCISIGVANNRGLRDVKTVSICGVRNISVDRWTRGK